MADMDPDIALNTFLGGRYGAPGQGIVAPMWARHPSVNVGATATTTTGPLDVNIVSPLPLQVEQVNEPLLPVETAFAQLGVIKDPTTGEPIGRVMIGRVTDELTGAVTETLTAYYEDGSVVIPYTGNWFIEGDCTVSTPAGVLPSW